MTDTVLPTHGLTVRETARYLRVGTSKILTWIRRGELSAINTATSLAGKARFIVLPEHLAEFERRRSTAPPPKTVRRRRKVAMIDYYPD